MFARDVASARVSVGLHAARQGGSGRALMLALALGAVAGGCGGGGGDSSGTGGNNGNGGTITGPGGSSATVVSVAVTVTDTTLAVGRTMRAVASARDAGGNVLQGRSMRWTTSDTAVASVDTGGTITARRPGSVIIRATVDSATGQAGLAVKPGPSASVQVLPAAVNLSARSISIRDSAQLTAVARDSAGNVITGRPVVWSTAASQVVSVTSSGVIYGMQPGSTTVRATVDSAVGAATVTVGDIPLASVTVSAAANTISPVSSTQVTAVLRASDGTVLGGRPVTWTTSDPSVARVVPLSLGSALASVVGVTNGTVKIRATVGSVFGETDIALISPKPWSVISLTSATDSYYPAGQIVPDSFAPSVLVRDANNVQVPGVAVTFTVTAGGGSITRASVLTDSVGRVTASGWRLGPALGWNNNALSVAVAAQGVQGNPLTYTYGGVGGPATTLRVLRGSGLIARPGRQAVTVPVVQAYDAAGNPASGLLRFAITAGGGRINGATVDSVFAPALDGFAFQPWVMGAAQGVNSVTVTSGTASAVVTVTASNALSTPFDVAVHYDASLSSGVQQVFQDVVQRWREGITTDFAPYHVQVGQDACYPGSPAIDTVTTGLVVIVRTASLSNAAGQTSVCRARTNGIPALAVATFTTPGIDVTTTPYDFAYVIAHEFGHALGLGSEWSTPRLVTGSPGSYRYIGANAVAEFTKVAGTRYGNSIPLDYSGDHWDPNVMPGDVVSSGAYAWALSTVSLAALKDLGYSVDLSKGDGFILPSASTNGIPAPSAARQPAQSSKFRIFGPKPMKLPPLRHGQPGQSGPNSIRRSGM